MFSYQFPAIRGIQANSEYYICMVPLKFLSRIFGENDEYVPPRFRAQRTLNLKRIPEIRDYILHNRNAYVFSALAASIGGDYEFKPIDNNNLGILYIDLDATLLINDGQHRKAAIIKAIELDETLKDETISIVFYADKGLERSQQMFTDLNKHAVNSTRSLNTSFDYRDPMAVLTKEVISKIEFFDKYTDMESDNLGDNSPNLFTLSMFYDAISNTAKGLNIDDENERAFIFEYWSEVEKNISEWQDLKERLIAKKCLKKEYIIVYGVAVLALGKLGNWLYFNNLDNYKNCLQGLRNVNWKRSNIKDWKNRAIKPNGQISRSSGTINLTYIRLKKILGLALTKDESDLDRDTSRKQ